MPIHVKDAGSWKEAKMWVRDAGSWKAVTGAVKDTSWKEFTSANPITMVAHTWSQTGVIVKGTGAATAGFTMLSNGDLQTYSGSVSPSIGATEWHEDVTSATGGDFEVKMTVTSGPTPSHGTYGSWQRMNAQRWWYDYKSGSSAGTDHTYLKAEFREYGGDGTIIHTVTNIQIKTVLSF